MVAAVRVVLAACLLSLVYANISDRTKATGLDKITVTVTRAKLEKKYVLRNIKVNWFKAFQMCLAEGKRLATITSEEENTKMRNMFKAVGLSPPVDIWLSLSDLAEEGNFVWMSTGDPVGYTNWYDDGVNKPGPNNSGGNEHCTHIVYQQRNDLERIAWNDLDCKVTMPFACEYFEEV